jgi:hypothetical protein
MRNKAYFSIKNTTETTRIRNNIAGAAYRKVDETCLGALEQLDNLRRADIPDIQVVHRLLSLACTSTSVLPHGVTNTGELAARHTSI